MKLEFNRKPKSKAIGIRLTKDEHVQVKFLAVQNGVSLAEACEVLIRAALKEVDKKMLKT